MKFLISFIAFCAIYAEIHCVIIRPHSYYTFGRYNHRTDRICYDQTITAHVDPYQFIYCAPRGMVITAVTVFNLQDSRSIFVQLSRGQPISRAIVLLIHTGLQTSRFHIRVYCRPSRRAEDEDVIDVVDGYGEEDVHHMIQE